MMMVVGQPVICHVSRIEVELWHEFGFAWLWMRSFSKLKVVDGVV